MPSSSRASNSVKISAAAIAALVAVYVGDGEMAVSERGVDALMKSEDCRYVVYRDAKGLPTAGCGHLVKKGEYRIGQSLSKDEVRKLFVQDLVPFNKCVNDGIGDTKTTQPQFDASVGLAYNIGCNKFLASSVLNYHKLGKYDKAADSFMLFVNVRRKGRLVPLRGLVNRRKREMNMYQGTYPD
jgi:GH24 family phage-related lysozyme (muramidase)